MQDAFFSQDEMGTQEYQVLARKYRPTTFSDMIGQDVMVRTFSNAISSSRIAHAFVMTGIRGVGKTTTARIIARALNCIGEDGKGGPTSQPCGKCEHCVAISNDNHQDILEMDAASHTGVNDIREIIDNARYRPISARYKIYIIDEVHMLSNSAFNALLKTLEEPPEHVKFIFATTEIRKIPITILSRCQRFDLKRVDVSDLIEHYKGIVQKEGLEADDQAIALIASVAGGSVRDGLSILDQALSHNEGKVTEEAVRDMLGLADTSRTYDLFETLVTGKIEETLAIAKELYDKGADSALIMQDLLEINHLIAKLKHADGKPKDIAELEWNRASKLAKDLSVVFLSRSWQMLLKGLEEVRTAYTPFKSLEMVLIRIAYASMLPSPEDLLKIDDATTPASNTNLAQNINAPAAPATPVANNNIEPAQMPHQTPHQAPQLVEVQSTSGRKLEDVLQILYDADEMLLYHHIKNDVRLVEFEGERLVISLEENAPSNLPQTLQDILGEATGKKWSVIGSTKKGQATLAELEMQADAAKVQDIKDHETVKEVLNTFTGAEILDIKTGTN